jgi:protein SCO1/2
MQNSLPIPDSFLLTNQDTITSFTPAKHTPSSKVAFVQKMNDNMVIIQEKFKDDDSVLLLSHTVAPEIDNSSIKKIRKKKKAVFLKNGICFT